MDIDYITAKFMSALSCFYCKKSLFVSLLFIVVLVSSLFTSVNGASSDAKILSYSWYTVHADDEAKTVTQIVVIGELENVGTSNIAYAYVTGAAFIGETKIAVVSQEAYGINIQPGQKVPFYLVFTAQNLIDEEITELTGVTDIEVSTGYVATNDYKVNVDVSVSSKKGSGSLYSVTGEITFEYETVAGKNARLSSIRVIATFYNSKGTVVSLGRTELLTQFDNEGSQSVYFTLVPIDKHFERDIVNYELFVQYNIRQMPNPSPISSPINGTPDEIMHIKTADELARIGGTGSVGKCYVLDSDIDLIGEWVPIEDFRGTFDGQGYSINNLYVLESSNRKSAGLFGHTNGDVTIKNAGVNINPNGLTATIATGSVYAGGLVGYSKGKVVVTNCYITGDITANVISDFGNDYTYAGGLIGYGDGDVTIENSYVTGDITAVATSSPSFVYAGGLIGASNYGDVTIENSYVTGDITAVATSSISFVYTYAGGLIGLNHIDSVNIKNSYAIGDITATSLDRNAYVGGLIGYNFGGEVVDSCYRLSFQKIIGDTINDAGTPLSPKEMKIQQSFVGWNFETIWAIESNINGGQPYLRSIVPRDEDGWSGSFWFIALLVVVIVLIAVGVVYILLTKRFR